MAEQTAQTTAASQAPQPVNPLDLQQKPQQSQQSEVVKSIVSTEGAGIGKSILGAAPKLDKSLLQDILPPASLLLTVLKSAFAFLMVFSIASMLFFTSQLTDKLDFVAGNLPNTSKDLAASNEVIKTLQTDLNVIRYLTLKANLDKFSWSGDTYMQFFNIAKSQTAEAKDKEEAIKQMALLKKELRDSFLATRAVYQKTFAAPLVDPQYADTTTLRTLYEEKLRMLLTERANLFKDSPNEQGRREYKNYDQTLQLVGNLPLAGLFLNTDFDRLNDDLLYVFAGGVKAGVINDLTNIQVLKSLRIKWSDIIDEIDLRTIDVDKNYNYKLYDEAGGIRYTSYDFDAPNRKISIIGETKRFDTANFTMIANLIDELNSSDFFEGAEMRSFSKSGSLEDGYTASLKLGLNLQEQAVTLADALLSPTEAPAELTEPVEE